MRLKQIRKQIHKLNSNKRSSLPNLKTPIERFNPDLWDDDDREYLYKLPFMNEPFENAMSVANIPNTDRKSSNNH